MLLIFLATIQATAGIGLISIVTAFLGSPDAPVSLSELHVFVPLILHGVAMAGEIGLVLRMDSKWKSGENDLVEHWCIDGVLFVALSAFGALIWFLVQTLW